MAGHVHILFVLHRTLSLADLVEEVKKGSSKWLKTRSAAMRNFHWQNGYGAFSVSRSSEARVRAYILNQEKVTSCLDRARPRYSGDGGSFQCRCLGRYCTFRPLPPVAGIQIPLLLSQAKDT